MSLLLLVVACVRGDDDVLRDPAATLRNRWAITRLRFEAITKRFVDEAPNATRSLARSDAPSPARPFVFLHQRKTGGTTLRKGLHRRAQQLGVHSWLPCFDDVPCQSYAAPEALANVSLLGGHLAWPNVAARLPGGFDCFTVFREPVARVESCWNFRFVQLSGVLGMCFVLAYHGFSGDLAPPSRDREADAMLEQTSTLAAARA